MLDSAVREAGTSSGLAERLLKKLEPQYVRLTMSATQRYEAWCGKKVSELKHYIVKII